MSMHEIKTLRRDRRKMRIRKRILGTARRPRMSVFRSRHHIYVQLIDDMASRTLCAVGTSSPALSGQFKNGSNKIAAVLVGKEIAAQAIRQGIAEVTFDRNGRLFHGRVKALADAAREGGLKF